MMGYQEVKVTLVSGKLAISVSHETSVPLFSGYEKNRNYLFLNKIQTKYS